jgi:HAE1 family hydrophobic/amphiphilic exporter-1
MAAVVGVSFAGMSALFPSYNPVKVIFFAQGDVDFVVLEIENPEGTTKEVTDIDVRRIEEVLYDEPDIESFTVTVGSGSQFGSGGSGEKLASIFINLTQDRERNSTEIVDDLRSQVAVFNDIKVTVNQPSEGPPTGAAVVVKFLGDDLNEITTLANSSAVLMRDIEGLVNVETSTNNNSTEFVFELDRAKAASLGLSPSTVSQIARTAVFGSDATSLTTLTDDIDVVVRLNVSNDADATAESANQTTIDAIEQISIPTQSGPVPLSSLVTTYLRESSSVINHEDGKRVVSVTADAASDANSRELQTTVVDQINAQLDIPDNVTISTGGGETEDSNQAFIEMALALVVGILLMVAVLVLQFNSYLHTKYVLTILPYSLIGIMFGLSLTQNPLSFPSIMGFIALSGIVVNNSILLIDMMNSMRKQAPDRPVKDIVLEASGNRLRPILLTTTTTVIGMVPLTYAGDLWSPLAYAVMFGLVFSVVITLVLIPILYYRNPGTVNS